MLKGTHFGYVFWRFFHTAQLEVSKPLSREQEGLLGAATFLGGKGWADLAMALPIAFLRSPRTNEDVKPLPTHWDRPSPHPTTSRRPQTAYLRSSWRLFLAESKGRKLENSRYAVTSNIGIVLGGASR